MEIESDKTYEVEFPFVRTTFTEFDQDGASEVPTWAPGVQYEMVAPDDSIPVAHGMGKMLLRVVSVHKLPKPYHTRIFFVRQWADPDGKTFGKTNLRILGIQAFRRRLSGYRLDDYGTQVEMRPVPNHQPGVTDADA